MAVARTSQPHQLGDTSVLLQSKLGDTQMYRQRQRVHDDLHLVSYGPQDTSYR